MSKIVQIAVTAIIAIVSALLVAGLVKDNHDSGLTKSEYLDMVRINYEYGDTLTLGETLCGYTYLIDKYGTKETYKMDMRAQADEHDIDYRLIEAIRNCT